jgi:hypothetical protein
MEVALIAISRTTLFARNVTASRVGWSLSFAELEVRFVVPASPERV